MGGMETTSTTRPVSRAVVERFYKAFAERDMDAIAGFLADDVVWTISGPVDLLPFCGQRTGKAAVMKLLERDIPEFLAKRRFVPNAMLMDGDRAAVLGRLVATKRQGGHAISYRTAHFMRFRDDKVIEYVSIIDSFDAVEQMIGRPLEVHDGGNTTVGGLVAV
jgi:ketosteroid isomerase-like protein